MSYIVKRSISNAFPVMKSPMLPPDTFKGKVAIISGGGTGLGKGITTNLAKLGCSVFITSRKENVLKEATAEIKSLSKNDNVGFYPADVRDQGQIAKALEECKKQLGSYPDLIVNNAAGNFISPTNRLSPNAFSSIIDIVLKGTINLTMSTSKHLIAEKRPGNYLNITTTYARTGSGYVVPSAAAKSGVEAFSKSLAAEYGKYGMRFNCIAPGPIYTKGAFDRLDPTGQFIKFVKNRLPTKRLGEVDELANLAAYLLSDYSSWMTGDVVTFDGGETSCISGQFNALNDMISEKDWDTFEKMIRKTNEGK